jgi:hypothetical protein
LKELQIQEKGYRRIWIKSTGMPTERNRVERNKEEREAKKIKINKRKNKINR